MRIFEFRSELWLPRPRVEVFRFFADAYNLEAITPSWLRFRVTTSQPISMRKGTEIEYQLKIRSLPVTWKSRITAWDPPHRFVDEQIRGPYRLWVHEHRFIEQLGGTLCSDYVQYSPPGGALTNALFVRKDIAKIFDYRSRALSQLFTDKPAANPSEIATTATTGAS